MKADVDTCKVSLDKAGSGLGSWEKCVCVKESELPKGNKHQILDASLKNKAKYYKKKGQKMTRISGYKKTFT